MLVMMLINTEVLFCLIYHVVFPVNKVSSHANKVRRATQLTAKITHINIRNFDSRQNRSFKGHENKS